MKIAKILSVSRIVVTHVYVLTALYLFAVLVKNTVDFHQFEFNAAKAFYEMFEGALPHHM